MLLWVPQPVELLQHGVSHVCMVSLTVRLRQRAAVGLDVVALTLAAIALHFVIISIILIISVIISIIPNCCSIII